MSELENRSEVEADFAKQLAKLSARQRRELKDKLGNPPDFQKITAEDWRRWERERRDEILSILFLIWLASFDQHSQEILAAQEGIGNTAQGEAVSDGIRWSARQADMAAKGNVDSAKQVLSAAEAAWRTSKASPEVMERILLQAFGPRKDAVTAATNTTRAITAGIGRTLKIARESGYKLSVVWRAERDGRSCPLCQAFDGKSESAWRAVEQRVIGSGSSIDLPSQTGGPPLHPNCRCYLQTTVR